jgi:large subunit ribosomal protein L17
MIDKLINTVNSKDEMNAIRYVMQYLFTEEASKELFSHVAPKYKDTKSSGFTRIVPIKYRDGDNAKLVLLELV